MNSYQVKGKKPRQKDLREQFAQLSTLKDFAEVQVRKEETEANKKRLKEIGEELSRVGALIK